MESRILFLGPVGAGKTTAIRAISDIKVVDTDAMASDSVSKKKQHTTVAMDLGVIELEGGDRIVLYGAPGQDRFDFMWEILLAQCEGVLLLLDHSSKAPLDDLKNYLSALNRIDKCHIPLLICITHTDSDNLNNIDTYENFLDNWDKKHTLSTCRPTVQLIDARKKNDIHAVLVTLAAQIEIEQRFPSRTCAT
jgi:signal recognition particle receptor subunit beta